MKTGIRGFEHVAKTEPSKDDAFMLEGTHSLEKEAFCFNFLEEVLKNKSDAGIYLFYGKNKKVIVDNLERKFKKIDIDKENMIWIDAGNASKGDNVLNCSINNPFTIMLALKQIMPALLKSKKRAVVNIINPMLLNRGKIGVYRFITDIIALFKVNNCPAVFLFQEMSHDEDVRDSFERLMDCVIKFLDVKKGKNVKKGLKINKSDFKSDSKIHIIELDEKGLKIL